MAAMAVKERKTAEERREEILVVALEEFGEHGLHGTSTDTVARKAGVSQPYLFRLFGTKKELYLEVVRQGYGELVEYVERVSGADAERVRDFFAFGMLLNVFASMDLLDQRAPWAKRLLQACLSPQ